jgi:hypothetical protein
MILSVECLVPRVGGYLGPQRSNRAVEIALVHESDRFPATRARVARVQVRRTMPGRDGFPRMFRSVNRIAQADPAASIARILFRCPMQIANSFIRISTSQQCETAIALEFGDVVSPRFTRRYVERDRQ